MRIDKIFYRLSVVASCLLAMPTYADESLNPAYSLTDMSVNYFNWSQDTKSKTAQQDFSYLEIENCSGWSWGDFYMFGDLENHITNYNKTSIDDMAIVLKPIADVKLYNNWSLHVQDYYWQSKAFYTNDAVVGISYKYVSDFGLWIKPFIGEHYQNTSYFSGLNGYMAGWVFNYDMKIAGEKFSLFQWHEIEFDRIKRYYQLSDGTPIGDGKSNGINGAISLWWNINKTVITGIQYRYAENKLGFEAYQAGMIYSLKYYF